jgi:hypothetical protein
MKRLLSKRNMIVLSILIVTLSLGIYLETRPRLAPGQAPLTDIQNIETLRTQFNQDVGKRASLSSYLLPEVLVLLAPVGCKHNY